jgi:hypothetical protein
MAYVRVSLDRYNERKQIVVRLTRHHEPFTYSEEVTLELYNKAVEDVKTAAEEKNAALDVADAKTARYNAACAAEEALLIRLRSCIGGDKGKNSDAYVEAGGARQSEVTASQQQTREDNKKAAEEAAKKKASEDKKPE